MTRPPVSVAPVKPIFLTVGLTSNSLADHAAGTGNDIQYAFRSSSILDRFIDDLAGAQIGKRCRTGGFDDDAVAREQRGPSLLPISETGKFHGRCRRKPRGFTQDETDAAGVEHRPRWCAWF
jgi:hypothetical protein